MGPKFEQVPDDLRGRADKKRAVVPGLENHARGDRDFLASLYEGAGLGVHPIGVKYPGMDERRTQRWMGLRDGAEDTADVTDHGATRFENDDIDGGSAVTRAVGES